MDFEPAYTPEQESFRQTVRDFLEEHVPRELRLSRPIEGVTHEQFQMQMELGRKLGEQGWLWPTYPSEFGGGGLDVEQAIIIDDEMDRLGLTLPPYYDSGGRGAAPAILLWGTEEQKSNFLPLILLGKASTWELISEPGAGSDMAGISTRAIRDGEDYVLNGQKIFVGCSHPADWMFTLAVTDPDRPRHENLSWFMVDGRLPGITVQPLQLLTSNHGEGSPIGHKNSVFLDNVRVPATCLIGGENNGWNASRTTMEVEHGGAGSVRRSRVVERLFEHCRSHAIDGQPMTKDPDTRDLLVDVFIESEITRLFGLRNFYMARTKKPRSYEGSQFKMRRKLTDMRIAADALKILGYSALTNDPLYGAAGGYIELHQRTSIVGLHPGGTVEIQKLIMARRLGIGKKVREQAAVLV